MSEQLVPVKVELLKMLCDVAGCKGEMRANGFRTESHPLQFMHQCTACGVNKSFPAGYPQLKWTEIIASGSKSSKARSKK